MDFTRKLMQQLRQIWQGMSRAQQVMVAGVTVVAVGALVVVGYLSSQTDYQVLFSGLAVEDAGAIANKLQAQNVRYQLASGGTTVLVPADQVQQLRVELAVEGLPSRGTDSFKLLDGQSLGMSPFTQHVNYLRALQGELAKTIMQIDPIVYARVHIVRPEPSPFMRDQKPTTASVMLKLRPGATLNRNVSTGIVSLVARSVEGLAKENVTLVDASGRLLSERHDGELGPIGTQIEYRRELEQYLANKAETMLAQVLGPGKAIVRVTADVNLKNHREKRELFRAEDRVVIKENTTSNKSSATTAKAASAVGTSANLGKGQGAGNSGGSNTNEETILAEYVVPKITEEIENKMGAVERLTIAALVDLTPAKTESGPGTPVISLADVQEAIKNAVGFKSERDQIKVTEVRMPETNPAGELDENWQKHEQIQMILSLVRNGSIALMALVGLVLGWMALRAVRNRRPAEAPADKQEEEATMSRVAQALERDPQVLVRVLDGWLREEEKRAA